MGVSVYLLCHIKFSLPPATKGVIKEKKKNRTHYSSKMMILMLSITMIILTASASQKNSLR